MEDCKSNAASVQSYKPDLANARRNFIVFYSGSFEQARYINYIRGFKRKEIIMKDDCKGLVNFFINMVAFRVVTVVPE